MTGTCQGCSSSLPPNKAPGRERKWCSDRCRKDHLYVRHCLDCGAKLNGSDGNGPNASVRCAQCAPKVTGAERKVWNRESVIDAIQAWALEHGEPPKVVDWRGAEGSVPRQASKWPSANAVFRECGSWKDAMAAAGFTPRAAGRPRKVAA